jgi:hypothetical protein
MEFFKDYPVCVRRTIRHRLGLLDFCKHYLKVISICIIMFKAYTLLLNIVENFIQ